MAKDAGRGQDHKLTCDYGKDTKGDTAGVEEGSFKGGPRDLSHTISGARSNDPRRD